MPLREGLRRVGSVVSLTKMTDLWEEGLFHYLSTPVLYLFIHEGSERLCTIGLFPSWHFCYLDRCIQLCQRLFLSFPLPPWGRFQVRKRDKVLIGEMVPSVACGCWTGEDRWKLQVLSATFPLVTSFLTGLAGEKSTVGLNLDGYSFYNSHFIIIYCLLLCVGVEWMSLLR